MKRTARRQFLAFICAALTVPRASQAARHLPRVGFVLNSAMASTMEGDPPAELVMRGFLQGLRELGYAEGRNILIERRTAEGKLERLGGLIRSLAEFPADVIVITGTAAALAARKVTATIPIVVAGMGSPVENGIVKNLSRPGGNITGLVPTFGPELAVKRLEIVREMLPNASRVAFFGVKSEWDGEKEFRTAAARMGMTLVFVDAQLPDVQKGLAQLERLRADALLVSASGALFVHLRAIADFASRVGLADFYGLHQAVDAGGLVSYGHDSFDIFRRAAGYVHRILNGAKAGELPIEQMDRYALVVNRKRARDLGLAVPPAILVRAERVIE